MYSPQPLKKNGVLASWHWSRKLRTQSGYTRDQWRDLGPGNLIGAVSEDKYIAFFRGTGQGFIVCLWEGQNPQL
jgi:hypothetical protein